MPVSLPWGSFFWESFCCVWDVKEVKEFIYVSAIGCGCKGHVFRFLLLGKTHFSGTALSTENSHGNPKRNGGHLSYLFLISYHLPLCQSRLCALSEPNRTISSCAPTPIQILYNKSDGLCSAANRETTLEPGPSSCPIRCGFGLWAAGPVRQPQHLLSTSRYR